jgi:hypothetical protein
MHGNCTERENCPSSISAFEEIHERGLIFPCSIFGFMMGLHGSEFLRDLNICERWTTESLERGARFLVFATRDQPSRTFGTELDEAEHDRWHYHHDDKWDLIGQSIGICFSETGDDVGERHGNDNDWNQP